MADQGFASMDDDKQREIASKGGQASKGGTNRATSTGKRTTSKSQSTAGKAKGGHISRRDDGA